MKRILKMPKRLINFIRNYIQLKRYNVEYDSSLKINGVLYVSGYHIRIGKNVKINSSYKANPIGGDSRTILRTTGDGQIVVGNDSGISNSTIVAWKSVIIGDHVLLGGSCKIYDTDFHSLDPEIRRMTPNEGAVVEPVVIQDNVFIGAHTIILKGVTIGANSIVGAGSVVTKDIPANEVWGGNPARFIRKI